MTATIEGKGFASPVETRGTGRPNKILLRDYADSEGWLFRVETDVHLNEKEFDQLRSLLEQTDPDTNRSIVTLLHAKLEQEPGSRKDKDDAKKMFSAGFGLLP